MIETKFMVWDKKSKKMRKLDSIAFDDKGNIKLINAWGYDIIEDKDIIVRRETQYKLLQYTGFKDRNDKEIYEGHIVRSFVPNRDESGAIIDYNDEITVFRDIRTAPEQFVFLTEPQIIGNIFENPELMEKVNG